MKIEYHSNNNVVYSCKCHVAWCPKYRRKVLVDGVDTRLKELIHSICQEIHVDIIEMEIMPDHIHLLIEVDPQFGTVHDRDINAARNILAKALTDKAA